MTMTKKRKIETSMQFVANILINQRINIFFYSVFPVPRFDYRFQSFSFNKFFSVSSSSSYFALRSFHYFDESLSQTNSTKAIVHNEEALLHDWKFFFSFFASHFSFCRFFLSSNQWIQFNLETVICLHWSDGSHLDLSDKALRETKRNDKNGGTKAKAKAVAKVKREWNIKK